MPVDVFQLVEAMVISFILIATVIFFAHFISRYGRTHAKARSASRLWPPEDSTDALKHFILLRVLLDDNDHASLSAFQFLCWTLLISFFSITLWILYLMNPAGDAAGIVETTVAMTPAAEEIAEAAVDSVSSLPTNLFALMGISVAIPIASQGISAYKRVKPRDEGETYFEPDYASMLEENGRPSLLRVQLFLWTFAALAIYAGTFIASAFSTGPDNLLVKGMPDINPTLLFLMGLSATGYLGNQAYSGKVEKSEETGTVQPVMAVKTPDSGTAAVRVSPSIREVIPKDVEPMGIVTLLGTGFGVQQDTIMIDEERISSSTIRRWEETRIEFSLPKTVSSGSHNLRIMARGETVNWQISVVGDPQRIRGIIEIDADIIQEIWIDDPYNQGYRIPPIGHFIPDKRYHFFFEFDVPPGTPSWGRIQFRASFFIDGVNSATSSFMPGAMNGRNYGNFNYVFQEEGKHHIEIRGVNTKTMDIEVKKPLIQ